MGQTHCETEEVEASDGKVSKRSHILGDACLHLINQGLTSMARTRRSFSHLGIHYDGSLEAHGSPSSLWTASDGVGGYPPHFYVHAGGRHQPGYSHQWCCYVQPPPAKC